MYFIGWKLWRSAHVLMTVVKIVNERSLQKYIATFVVEIVFLIVRAYSSKGDEMLGGSFFEEDPFFA